jgi:hypothetical protein
MSRNSTSGSAITVANRIGRGTTLHPPRMLGTLVRGIMAYDVSLVLHHWHQQLCSQTATDVRTAAASASAICRSVQGICSTNLCIDGISRSYATLPPVSQCK